MTSTKLSKFCDNVLEMGWLLGVIITPLFFNVYSSRVFEPDKLTTLRTLALIMAVVWVVKIIDERAHGRRDVGLSWQTPLVKPTLFTVAIYLVSTVLSVNPWVSFFGSYQRLQGTYTTLAYMAAMLNAGGLVGGWLVLFIIAIIVDIANWGGSGHSYRRRKVVVVRER